MPTELKEKIIHCLKYKDSQEASHILIDISHNKELQLDPEDYLKLNYIRFNSLNEERVLSLMKQSILIAYDIENFDLYEKFLEYIELLFYPEFIIKFLYKLKTVLIENEELLSDKQIEVKGILSSPTVKNWFLDYESKTKSTEHDALDVVNYMNSSSNVKLLNQKDREILQNLIKIFNRVNYYINFWEKLPEQLSPQQEREFQEYFEKLSKEENIIDTVDSSGIASGASNTDRVPIVDSPKEQKNINEVKSIVEPKPNVNAQVVPVNKTPAQPFKLGTTDGIRQQPKRGLVFDLPTNIDLNEIEENAKQQEKKQQDIAVKLEELKKRKKDQK